MPFPPAGHSTILNALRVALRIISGKYIFKFAILENLRIFQNCLFTGGVLARTLSGISLCSMPAPPKGELFGCCRKAVPQHKAGLLSLASRKSFRLNRKVSGSARSSLPEGAVKPAGFD